jgi:hypothetical protein
MYWYSHICTPILIYIHVCVCVCVCVYIGGNNPHEKMEQIMQTLVSKGINQVCVCVCVCVCRERERERETLVCKCMNQV